MRKILALGFLVLSASLAKADVIGYGGAAAGGVAVKDAATGPITAPTTDTTGKAALSVVDRDNRALLESIDIRTFDMSMNQILLGETEGILQNSVFLENELR